MTILVTGGTGYIGSHTTLELLRNNEKIVIIDNLSNSTNKVIPRLEKLSNKKIDFIKGDIRNKSLLKKIFNQYNIDSVIHFAGLKAVGESVEKPIYYYDNNIHGTLTLLEAMQEANIFNLVFSSSATVYGDVKIFPITEEFETGKTTNPYGSSKYFIEQILKDVQISNNKWSIIILRYFNPIGADSSGLIGENPNGIPNNLLPYICQVAIGKLEKLYIFGNDYPTKDGTGIRDYIHVTDLAVGHIKSLKKHKNNPGLYIYNLGTGIGYSVLDIVNTFTKITNKKIPFTFAPRREGDVAICYASANKAKYSLNWETKKNLNDMIKDSINWQNKNPNGYI